MGEEDGSFRHHQLEEVGALAVCVCGGNGSECVGGVGECEWCVGAVLTAYTTLRIRHETFILTRCETRVFPQPRCTCIASVT